MSIIDSELLIEHVDGDMEFLQETFEIFCQESKTKQAELRAALNAADLEAVQSIAHSLKGMLSNFLAEPAFETAGQIESISDPHRLASAAALLDKLSSQIELTAVEIQQTIESGRS